MPRPRAHRFRFDRPRARARRSWIDGFAIARASPLLQGQFSSDDDDEDDSSEDEREAFDLGDRRKTIGEQALRAVDSRPLDEARNAFAKDTRALSQAIDDALVALGTVVAAAEALVARSRTPLRDAESTLRALSTADVAVADVAARVSRALAFWTDQVAAHGRVEFTPNVNKLTRLAKTFVSGVARALVEASADVRSRLRAIGHLGTVAQLPATTARPVVVNATEPAPHLAKHDGANGQVDTSASARVPPPPAPRPRELQHASQHPQRRDVPLSPQRSEPHRPAERDPVPIAAGSRPGDAGVSNGTGLLDAQIRAFVEAVSRSSRPENPVQRTADYGRVYMR